MRADARGLVDPAVQALLDEVAAPLAGRVRNRTYRFEVAALAGPEPNAFALPGGYIFVAPALVELAGHGRDELAFIVAHEMAHVIRRHAIDRILSQRALQAVTLASPAARSIAPWVRTVGVRWLEKAYSRDQEFEADELGGRLMRGRRVRPGRRRPDAGATARPRTQRRPGRPRGLAGNPSADRRPHTPPARAAGSPRLTPAQRTADKACSKEGGRRA